MWVHEEAEEVDSETEEVGSLSWPSSSPLYVHCTDGWRLVPTRSPTINQHSRRVEYSPYCQCRPYHLDWTWDLWEEGVTVTVVHTGTHWEKRDTPNVTEYSTNEVIIPTLKRTFVYILRGPVLRLTSTFVFVYTWVTNIVYRHHTSVSVRNLPLRWYVLSGTPNRYVKSDTSSGERSRYYTTVGRLCGSV